MINYGNKRNLPWLSDDPQIHWYQRGMWQAYWLQWGGAAPGDTVCIYRLQFTSVLPEDLEFFVSGDNRYRFNTGFAPWEVIATNAMEWGSFIMLYPAVHFHADRWQREILKGGGSGWQPAEMGFASVEISPMPGHLRHLTVQMIHHGGMISAEYRIDNNTLYAVITLPEGLPGTFRFEGATAALHSGCNEIKINTNRGLQ